MNQVFLGTLGARVPSGCRAELPPVALSVEASSVLRAAEPVDPVAQLGRVLDDLREAHDGHGVVRRDLAAIDLLEEVHHLVDTAELGVVVLDVPWRKVADPLDLDL